MGVTAAGSWGKADAARFLAEDAHYLVTTFVEVNHADGKAEVLEVLTHRGSMKRGRCQM